MKRVVPGAPGREIADGRRLYPRRHRAVARTRPACGRAHDGGSEGGSGKLGNGKAIGVDNVCGQLLKFGNSENSASLKCFHNIVVAVWQQEVVPQDWKDAIITVHFKKGDPYECGNFRGISLGAHAGKVVLKVVAMRLNAYYCEWRKIFLEAQYGFRVGLSTDGMIYVVRGVQELAGKKTCRCSCVSSTCRRHTTR